MLDTLILSHNKQFVIPLRQVAHFRLEAVKHGNSIFTYKLFAVSTLTRGDGAWFEIFIDEFESNEAALKRIELLADTELFYEGREPSPEPPPATPELVRSA